MDFADDVSLPAEMLEVLVLTLTVMQEEASTFGLQINWSKTKIRQVPSSTSSSTVQVADGHVEVVDAYVYLECLIDSSGGSRGEVLRRIGMTMLERRIWKSSIRLETKLCLYQTYIVPVVWVRDVGHHKVPALSPQCIWHMGTTQDLEDTVYSPCRGGSTLGPGGGTGPPNVGHPPKYLEMGM